MVLLATWCLWKERNRQTFDRRSRTPSELLSIIMEEADAWIGAGLAAWRCSPLRPLDQRGEPFPSTSRNWFFN